MDNVDQRLVELCRRDEIIAVRDEAKKAAGRGDKQAVYVLAWMSQLLNQHGERAQARAVRANYPRARERTVAELG